MGADEMGSRSSGNHPCEDMCLIILPGALALANLVIFSCGRIPRLVRTS